MAQLIDRLGSGPSSPGFALAVRDLRSGPPASWPEDRAEARRSMIARRWCIPALVSYDPWRVEELLLEIFRRTVIPDLTNEAIGAEVAGWADEHQAPTAVIRALAAAAHQAGAAQFAALERALTPALYRRWLAEHSIYATPTARATAPPQSEPVPRRRLWKFFVAGERSAVIASILVWICVLLLITLVISVAL